MPEPFFPKEGDYSYHIEPSIDKSEGDWLEDDHVDAKAGIPNALVFAIMADGFRDAGPSSRLAFEMEPDA